MCLRGTSTPSSTIHTNSNVVIYRSEIKSVPFEFFCVISSTLTSGIHSCLHTIVSRYSVRPIHTPPQPPPNAYMNTRYFGSPVISYVNLVGSAGASCHSCFIPFTYCLTAVDVTNFTHAGYLPSICQ